MLFHKKPALRASAFALISTLIFVNFAKEAEAEMINLGANHVAAALSHDGSLVYLDYVVDGDFGASIYKDGISTVISRGDFDQITFYETSYDGSVAVGDGFIGLETYPGDRRAIKYENGVVTDIGNLGGDFAEAFDLSGDGSIIVGASSDGEGNQYAFKYQNNLMTSLGSIGGGNSFATGISGNGAIIIGGYGIGDDDYGAFKYENNQMTDIGTFGGTYTVATDISYDGSIIVGGSNLEGDLQTRAFKYTEDEGMVSLGTLAGGDYSYATGSSYSGKVIVGYSDFEGNETRAFKYTEEGGMVNLGTLGGDDSYARAVSHDGSVISGWSTVAGNTITHAFIIRSEAVDEGGPNLVDVNNTVAVLSKNSSQLNSVLNLNESLLKTTLEQDSKIFGKNNLSLSIGTRYLGLKADNRNNDSAEVGGTLKLAYRFNSNFRAGVFLDQGLGDNMPDNFKTRREMPMVGVFATLSERADDLGFSLKLAAAYTKSDLQITRDILSNTEAGMGSASLTTKGALAQLAYGFKAGDKFMLQPYVGFRFTDVVRDSFIETSGADFPISFDEARKKSITALLGAKSALKLSDRFNAKMAIGIERDLQASLDGYAGDISYLGAFDLTPERVKEIRMSGNVGLEYRVSENQEVGVDLFYLKQSVSSSDVAVAYLSYSIGF